MDIVGEVLIGIGYKTDTKQLEQATKRAAKEATETEKAYKDASKGVQKAQDALADAVDDSAKRQAKAALESAKKQERAAKGAAKVAKDAWREQEQAAKGAADRSKAAAKRFEDNWKRPLKRLGIAFAALGTAAAIGLGKMVLDMAAVGDQAAKDAKKLSLTAEAVQELGHAAELSGANYSTVKIGLMALTRGLNDATTKGTGPAAEAFEQLGISLEDPIIQSQDFEQILPLLANKFAELKDGTDKTAMAMKLFSESGAELIPMLNEGSEGLAAMRQEARDLGKVVSNEAAKSSEEFNDDLTRLKATVTGVRNSIGVELLPVLGEYVAQIQEWIQANRAVVIQKVKEWIQGVTEAVKDWLPIIKDLVGVVGVLTGLVLKLVEALGASGLVAAVVGAKIAITSLGVASTTALGPLGLIVGVFTALLPLALQVGSALGDAASRMTALGRAAAAAESAAGGVTGRRGKAHFIRAEFRARAATLESRRSGYQQSLEAATSNTEKAYWRGKIKRVDVERRALSDKNRAAAEKTEAWEQSVEGEFTGPVQSGGRKKKAPGGGGASVEQRDKNERLAAAKIIVGAPGGIAAAVTALANARGASPLALSKSIQAATEALSEGSSEKIARRAAVDTLARLVGFEVKLRDPSADPLAAFLGPQPITDDPYLAAALGPQTAPAGAGSGVGATLAGIFGDERLPSAPIREITKGAEPQVLLSTINNTYTIDITNEIDGAQAPQIVANEIESRFRRLFRDEVESLTKMSKVVFAR